MIVTVSREFGSGGREIGKRLADSLNLAYYDSEIIALLAKETGMSKEYIENITEKRVYPYVFQFANSFSNCYPLQDTQTEILVKQNRIIKEIAKKGNCVIVGRGANTILRDFNTFDLFVYSDMQSKIDRCIEKADEHENLSEKDIKKKIIQINKDREKFHSIISNDEWGKKENYDLCINTTGIEIPKIIPALEIYVKNWFEK